MSKQWKVVLATLLGALTLVAFSGCKPRSEVGQLCAIVTTIASDRDKVRYVKQWAESHLRDERFRATLRSRHEVMAWEERLRESGDLDWKYLGIAGGTGELEFHGPILDSGETDESKIGAVEIWVGRSSVLVRLSQDASTSPPWLPGHMSEMKPMSEDAFVFCGEEG